MKRIISLALLMLFALAANSQEMKKTTVIPENLEIGIIEHLGDTIPMDLWFLNEDNDTVIIGDLIDKPTILLFVYFDCPFMCSPLMDGVAEVVSNLDMNLGTDYQIITISFNTKDTPEKAREKKVNFVQRISKENQKHWMYLTGTQENITQMTEALG
ncbi:MAG: SCO family protein, partial [Bacteroidales bacterium]|nr:SCO family protein [Bacteroidales bacterium]